MVNPLFQIGGIASGLDTAGIIDQLMQIERAPVQRFERSQKDLRSVDTAWSRIVGKLSGFRTAVDDVRKTGALAKLTTASSSDEAAVSVKALPGGEPGSMSFTVEALASRHRLAMDTTFSSPAGLVGAGAVELFDETGASLGTITTDATTTLQGLSDQIDALGVGIDAQVLKVTDSSYQLVLASKTTGAASQFTLSSSVADLGAVVAVSTGTDARLTVGGLSIHRSSNTIDDLVPGASITLRKTTTSEVTVDVARDTKSIVDRVKALVTNANGVLDQIAKDTAYNAESGVSGVLQGDSLARDLAFQLRDAFTQVVGNGDISYFGEIGISLTRGGKLALDETKLQAALAENPLAVTDFLSSSISGTPGVKLAYVGKGAADGDITMSVTQAATIASVTGAKFSSKDPVTFTIDTPDGQTVAITIDKDMTAAQAVARINSALETAGASGMTASYLVDGNKEHLQFTARNYGSKGTFTITGLDATADGTHTGLDAIVDFGGGPVTGSGRSVVGSGAAAGLTLTVTGGVGSYDLNYSSGLGGVLDRFLATMEGVGGRIQAQRDSLSGQISDYDDQIEAFEERLRLREANLRGQFTALESAMGRLQSQGQWLAGALGGLGGGGG